MLNAEEMSMTSKAELLIRFYGFTSKEVNTMEEDEINNEVQDRIDEFDPKTIDDFEDRYGDDEDISLFDILSDEADRNDLSLMFPNAESDDYEDELEDALSW